MTELTLLSLGAGVQSTTLALMSAEGVLPKVDGAIFADTMGESAATYEHLDRLAGVLADAGIPLYRVSKGDLAADAVDPAHRYASIPYFVRNPDGSDGMGRRQCTSEYKLTPINRKVRELLGAAAPDYRRVPKGAHATQWIGFSLDEIGRVSDRDQVSYVTKTYPLIDARMSRADCERWLRRRGWTEVGKSSCIFCPYHGNRAWRQMRDQHPDEFARAVAFDAQIRRGGGSGIASRRHRVPAPLPAPARPGADRPDHAGRVARPADGHLRPARRPRRGRGRDARRVLALRMPHRPTGTGWSLTCAHL